MQIPAPGGHKINVTQVYTLTDGNFILVGNLTDASGSEKGMLLKMSNAGSILIQKEFTVDNKRVVLSTAESTLSGDIIIAGVFKDGSQRAFVARLKPDLTVLWIKQLNLSSTPETISIDFFDNSNIAFAVKANTTLVYGSIDADGNLQYTRLLEVNGLKELVGIQRTGHLYVDILVNTERAGKKVAELIEFIRGNGVLAFSHVVNDAGEEFLAGGFKAFEGRGGYAGVAKDRDDKIKLVRIDYFNANATETEHRYVLPALTAMAARTAIDNTGDAVALSIPSAGKLIFLRHYIHFESTPDFIRQYDIPVGAEVSGFTRSFDGGYLFALNNANGSSIVLIKTDSAGILPGCGYETLQQNFTVTRLRALEPVGGNAPEYAASTQSAAASAANLSLTSSFDCNQTYCPASPVDFGCADSYYKTYRSSHFADPFSSYQLMRNNRHLLLTQRIQKLIGEETITTQGMKILSESGQLIKSIDIQVNASLPSSLLRKMTDSTCMLMTYSTTSTGDRNFTFTLFDDDLNLVWSRTFRPSNTDEFYSGGFFDGSDMLRDADGNYYFVGTTLGFNVPSKMTIYKMDAQGNPVWLKSYSGNIGDNFGSVKAVATATSIVTLVETGKQMSVSVRIDRTSGQLQESYRYDRPVNTSISNRIAALSNNKIYFAGSIDSKLFVAVLDTNGRPLRMSTINNGGSFRGGDVRDGNVYLYHQPGINQGYLKLDENLKQVYYHLYVPEKSEAVVGAAVSESGHFYAAGNLYVATNNSFVDPFLRKLSPDGKLGNCQYIESQAVIDALPIQLSNYNLAPTISAYTTATLTAQFPVNNAAFNLGALLCTSADLCKSLDIEAPSVVCGTGSDFNVQIKKTAGCTNMVNWTYDTTYVRLEKSEAGNAIFHFSVGGSYLLKAKLSGGCSVLEDSIHVNVTATNLSLNLGNDTSFCKGNILVLNAGRGFASYKWQDGSIDSTFTVGLAGRYYVETKDGCGNINSDTVEVKETPAIPLDLGADTFKCNGDTLTLLAPEGFLKYQWSPSISINESESRQAKVFPSTNTLYKLRAEKTAGCFAEDSILVSVYHSPTINLGTDTSFCMGQQVTLNAGPGFVDYSWSNGMSGIAIEAVSPGKYSVSARDVNGCFSRDTLHILQVYDLPDPNIPNDSWLCAGETRVLNAAPGFRSYSWNTGSRVSQISVNAPGLYAVEVEDQFGCKGSDSVSIVDIMPLPSKFLGIDTAICKYSKLNLGSANSYKSYLWSTGANSRSITINNAGSFWLQVTDEWGCTGKDTVVVQPKDCLEGFYISNAFTPNQDGRNDLFKPMLLGPVTFYQFSVFNRYGELVFRSNDPEKGWDGRHRGVMRNNASFVWSCTYQFEGGERKNERGVVVLVR